MDVRADLGEQLAVDISLFVTLGVSRAPLVDLPQEHLSFSLLRASSRPESVIVQGAGIHSDSPIGMEAMAIRRR